MVTDRNRYIAQIPAGRGREIRVAVTHYKGRDLLDVRQWVEIDGEWKATQKGVSVQAANAILLADAVKRAADELASLAEAS